MVADSEDQPRCWQQRKSLAFNSATPKHQLFQCWIGWSSANLELGYFYGQILGSTVYAQNCSYCSTQNFHQNCQILTSWWNGFMKENLDWWYPDENSTPINSNWRYKLKYANCFKNPGQVIFPNGRLALHWVPKVWEGCVQTWWEKVKFSKLIW